MEDDFTRLNAKLHSLRTTELRKIQRKALKEVGQLVRGVIEFSAPIQAGTARGTLKAGELKASIKYRVTVPTDEGTLAGQEARVVIGPAGKIVKLIAHDVEYGHGSTPQHPFIRPAADAVQQQAVDLFQENLTAGVQKAMNNA